MVRNLHKPGRRTGPSELVGAVVAFIAIVSLATWYWTRESLPDTIRIATASRGSFYFDIGDALSRYLEESVRRPVEIVQTRGSLDNLKLLADGGADLAIIEASAFPADGIGVLSPLFSEFLHIVVRRGSGIMSVADLDGARIALGEPGSAIRQDAFRVLEHYRIDAESADIVDGSVDAILADDSIDATMVMTGLLSRTLDPLWSDAAFDLLALEDAAALSLRHAFFFEAEIPRGLYRERPAIPSTDTTTVATTALLVVRDDASKLFVRHNLETLFESDLRFQFVTLIKASEAEQWRFMPLHPLTRAYFRPYEGIELLASFMESLAATKDILFAFAAGLYLLWSRYRDSKRKEQERALQELKERLDRFLDETIRIERAQMETEDSIELKDCLDAVTIIKLKALEELSHEDLRGDRAFHIFLTQCANLIAKIQAKIEACEALTFEVPVVLRLEARCAHAVKNEIVVRNVGDPLRAAHRYDHDISGPDIGRLEAFDFHAAAAFDNDVALVDREHVERGRDTRLDPSPGNADIGIPRVVPRLENVAALFGDALDGFDRSQNVRFHPLESNIAW